MTDETTGPAAGDDAVAGDATPEATTDAESPTARADEHLGARARRRAARTAPPREIQHPPRPARPARPSRAAGATTGDAAPATTSRARAEAERIDVQKGSIGSAMARSVSVTQGAIGGVQAEDVTISQGALGGVRAQRVSLERGALGGAIAGDLRVHQGYVRAVIARDVTFEQAGARTVVANHVTFGRQSGAFLVLARTVDGGGRTFVDWRGAVAFGAAFALATAFLRHRIRGR